MIYAGKIILMLLIGSVVAAELFLINYFNPLSEDIIITKKNIFISDKQDIQTNIKDNTIIDEQSNILLDAETIETVPRTLTLKVPFTSQAPYADWSENFNEACEEASVLMFHYYYKNKDLNQDLATEEILKIIDWQKDNLEGRLDINAEQTAVILRDYFGYKNIVVWTDPEITADDIKYILYKNGPVIIPAAGRVLKNKYFRGEGPLYHMLVITGYNSKNFITNDPGTKNGLSYEYPYNTIIQAMHDLPAGGKEYILDGQRALIFLKNN